MCFYRLAPLCADAALVPARTPEIFKSLRASSCQDGPVGRQCISTEATSVKRIKQFLASTSGATAIEYGLIAALIAVAVIGGVTSLG